LPGQVVKAGKVTELHAPPAELETVPR
jgi:hypothetical protein